MINNLLFDIEITNKCNLNCKYCQSCYGRNSNKDLNTKEVYSLMDWIRYIQLSSQKNNVELFFVGNEPFLRKDIYSILEYADINGIKNTGILTNGTFIAEENISLLKKLNVKVITISVDDSIEFEFDKLTQIKGSYKAVLNGIKSLVKFKETTASELPYLIATTVITKNNISRLNEIGLWLYSLGFDRWQLIPVQHLKNSLIYNKLGLLPEHWKQIEFVIDKFHSKLPNFIIMNKKYLSQMKKYVQDKMDAPKYSPACQTTFLIKNDGFIFPCYRWAGKNWQDQGNYNEIKAPYEKFGLYYQSIDNFNSLLSYEKSILRYYSDSICKGCCHLGNMMKD